MKYKISIHAKDVMAKRNISSEWVEQTLNNPGATVKIADNEVHYFATIVKNADRCLKVVFNPLNSLVITTYFDRKVQKKGCK